MSQLTNLDFNEPIWNPSEQQIKESNLTEYIEWLNEEKDLTFNNYHDLWEWSVDNIEVFWISICEFFNIEFDKFSGSALDENNMPQAKWFPDSSINYAKNILRTRNDTPAIISYSETRAKEVLTYNQLFEEVARVANGLKALGVSKGDRVVAYLPNISEAIISFLASASIGAIWSSCGPEFGTRSVIDRFKQIDPKVLITIDGYIFGGKEYSKITDIEDITSELPNLDHVVMIPYLNIPCNNNKFIPWENIRDSKKTLDFEIVDFNHPLWILYSSGTTGLPKPIVHGHGGIILEHIKSLALHLDIKPEDRFFWYTTTGWMMWNMVVSALFMKCSIVIYDGSASYPSLDKLWRFVDEAGITFFGTSASYIHASMKSQLQPKSFLKLQFLRSIGSTGSSLSPEGFLWINKNVGERVQIASYSGGTDVCTGIVGPATLLPVYVGEIQCRSLGAKVEAYDQNGNVVINEVGELVMTKPFPSMPLFLWGDLNWERYLKSYFYKYSDVWNHGDWFKVTLNKGCLILGRSDATLNRGGVRMGTSEFYSVIENMVEIKDSLIIDTSNGGKDGILYLFVVLANQMKWDSKINNNIVQTLKKELSPRHVPDKIFPVDDIPKTLNGKKIEIPIKRLLLGESLKEVLNEGSVDNLESIKYFTELQKNEIK